MNFFFPRRSLVEHGCSTLVRTVVSQYEGPGFSSQVRRTFLCGPFPPCAAAYQSKTCILGYQCPRPTALMRVSGLRCGTAVALCSSEDDGSNPESKFHCKVSQKWKMRDRIFIYIPLAALHLSEDFSLWSICSVLAERKKTNNSTIWHLYQKQWDLNTRDSLSCSVWRSWRKDVKKNKFF